jgi:hypothetical protein
MHRLVAEFRVELEKMDVDLDGLDRRIGHLEANLDGIQAKQEEASRRTGTDVYASSRGWIVTRRGLGPDSGRVPLSRLAAQFGEMGMKSVPAPGLLFDARLRVWNSLGRVYEEPITPEIEVRKITFTNFNEVATLQVGDYYKSFTPLTLYNDDPWHTRLKPTYFERIFADAEDLTLTDQGPAWHLRGVNVKTKENWPDHPILTRAALDVFFNRISSGGSKFAGYFAGSQADLAFWGDKLGVLATGTLLWKDPASQGPLYNPDSSITWAQRYRVTSAAPRVKFTLPPDVVLNASFELAGSRYEDDVRNPDRTFEDWAARATGSLEAHGVKLEGKVLNVGPQFYSPGAQTLRRTPGSAMGYLSADEWRDFSVVGSRNRDLFLGVERVFFAPYDRVADNIFPYGDATPNREGFVAGLSAVLGSKGWLKPGAFYTKADELKPAVVLVPGAVPALKTVDSMENTAVAHTRAFKGMEGVLTADAAAALGGKDKLVFGFDFRNQQTDLKTQSGNVSLKTDTWMATADFILPLSWMRWADLSFLYGREKAAGSEYADFSGLASYPSYGDSSALGTYRLKDARDPAYNFTRDFWAVNLKFAVGKNAALKSSVYQEQLKPKEEKDFDSRHLEWRMGYEVSI